MKSTHLSVAPLFATSKLSKLCATALLACSSYSFSAAALAGEHHVHNEPEAAHAHAHAAKGHSQQAENQTQALAKAMADYHKAKPEDKSKHLGQVMALAEERQAMLAELAQTDPAAAVRAALPAAARKGMPEDIQAILEQEQELEGELEVAYEDYEDHSKSRLRHVLKTPNGRVELHLPANANAHAMQSGMKVRAQGWQFKENGETLDSLALNDELGSLSILAQDSTTTTSTTSTTTAALTNTFGEQRTLVLLVNFQDNTQQPWTVEETREMVFGKVNDFYKENSNGQTWLSGDVHGYNTLPIDSTTCDSSGIDSYARKAAEDDGIDLRNYSRLIYLFPKISSCGWTGKGTVGGSQSRAWINGSFTLNTIGHELGHNYGLHHAEYLECGSGVISGSCYSKTYGDNLDIMGSSTGHFNAFNKEYLGWLSPASGEIVTADSDGSYQLEPYESVPSGAAKGLKIPRGTDPTTGQALWYYLEYRQPVGFDSFLADKNGITEGVVFHLATESNTRGSQLIDMTPESTLYEVDDIDDAALPVGSSYTDPDAGVTITTEWADSTGASVHVSFSKQVCTQSNPLITLAPNDTTGVMAGTTVSYSATVTNNDSSGCTASDFNVSANVPAGWAATGSTLNLAPGETSTVTLNVTSAETAADGTYNVAINAENSSDSNYHSSSVASYVVETPVAACELANPVLSLTANQTGEVTPGTTVSYTATVTSQDSSNCEAAVVDVVASVPSGWSADSGTVTLAPGATASVNLNITSASTAADGEYAIDVNTFNTADISYNSSAVGSYIIAAPEPVCVAAAPLLSISASEGEVVAGSTVNYNATVTNRDSSDCTATNFAVSANVPAGWSADSQNINLAPGESKTVNISVTSAATASDGVYNITMNTQNTGDTQFSSSDTVSYTIVTPVNNAPVAVNDAVTLPAKEAILIDVLANDSDPDGDNLTIITVTQGAKGSVQITSNGQLLYTPAKSFKSSDSFSYTISDGEKTSTATASISLASSDGGSKPGKGNNK